MTLDNDGIHDSLQVRRAPATLKGRVTLHLLGPYGRDHNRVERAREGVYADVTRNHRCRTMQQLMDRVKIDLNHRSRRGHHCYPRATAV